MLNDLIGVKRESFDSFLAEIDSATIREGSHWKHASRSPHNSISIKFDKYIEEQAKLAILSFKPRQGAFAGKSIFNLVEKHKENKYVLIADVKSYFETIQFVEIGKTLIKIDTLAPHAQLIKVFYFNEIGTLKRGLRASAAISEFIGIRIDGIVQKLIHDRPLEYSRYYDDLVISGQDLSELQVLKEVIEQKLLTDLNLTLNHRKTKIKKLHGMKILGLRFHAGEVKVPQSFKNKIRAEVHSYQTANYNEEDYDSVRDAKRHVGTIIGSIRYLLDYSPTLAKGSYEDLMTEYYDELGRLEEIRQELAVIDDENIGR